MNVLSKERYTEIKSTISSSDNTTQSQLAKKLSTNTDTIERVWISINYEDYLRGVNGGKMIIEDLNNLEEIPLEYIAIEEVKKPSVVEKFKNFLRKLW